MESGKFFKIIFLKTINKIRDKELQNGNGWKYRNPYLKKNLKNRIFLRKKLKDELDYEEYIILFGFK